MSRETDPGHYPDRALVSLVTARHMPDANVSERTQTTYANGAALMLQHLSNGRLGLEAPGAKETLGELLGRLIANARAQGVSVAMYGDPVDTDTETLSTLEQVKASPIARTIADVLAHTSLADSDGSADSVDHWSDSRVLSTTQDLLQRLRTDGYTILPPG